MALQQDEIKLYKSSNTIGLGGAIDIASEIVSDALNNIFTDVTSAEALSGMTDYRCFYVRNTNTVAQLIQAGVMVVSDSTNPTTSVELGLGTASFNATEQVVPNKTTAPAGVSFGTGTVIKGSPPANGGYFSVWIKRIVDVDADASATDKTVIRITGDVV